MAATAEESTPPDMATAMVSAGMGEIGLSVSIFASIEFLRIPARGMIGCKFFVSMGRNAIFGANSFSYLGLWQKWEEGGSIGFFPWSRGRKIGESLPIFRGVNSIVRRAGEFIRNAGVFSARRFRAWQARMWRAWMW
jgi:hypothetical protein